MIGTRAACARKHGAASQRTVHVRENAFEGGLLGVTVAPPRIVRCEMALRQRIAAQLGGVLEVANQVTRRAVGGPLWFSARHRARLTGRGGWRTTRPP